MFHFTNQIIVTNQISMYKYIYIVTCMRVRFLSQLAVQQCKWTVHSVFFFKGYTLCVGLYMHSALFERVVNY